MCKTKVKYNHLDFAPLASRNKPLATNLFKKITYIPFYISNIRKIVIGQLKIYNLCRGNVEEDVTLRKHYNTYVLWYIGKGKRIIIYLKQELSFKLFKKQIM